MSEKRWSERKFWTPRFELRVLEEQDAQRWPRIVVERWEENGIGERRLDAVETYWPPHASLSKSSSPEDRGDVAD